MSIQICSRCSYRSTIGTRLWIHIHRRVCFRQKGSMILWSTRRRKFCPYQSCCPYRHFRSNNLYKLLVPLDRSNRNLCQPNKQLRLKSRPNQHAFFQLPMFKIQKASSYLQPLYVALLYRSIGNIGSLPSIPKWQLLCSVLSMCILCQYHIHLLNTSSMCDLSKNEFMPLYRPQVHIHNPCPRCRTSTVLLL